MTDTRWPGWVYQPGDEPDYRFSFANERTFLAWIRTSLALIAGGVALDAVDVSMSSHTQRIIAGVLVVLGMVCAAAAWVRWARAELAMRRREPLPSSPLSALLTLVLVAVAIGMAAILL